MTALPWVTVGVDLFDVFEQQVRDLPDGIDVTVLCNVLSTKAAGQLRASLDSGRFASVRVVVDRGAFQRRTVNSGDGQVENVADIEGILGAARLRGTCTHIKAIVWEAPGCPAGCLVTSANLNRNNRPESHERADGLALHLTAIADALFEALPPGVLIDSSTAYGGIRAALDAADDAGARVWDAGITDAAPGAHIGNKIGMGDLLGLVAEVGAPARVWVSTWSLQAGHAQALCGLAAGGVDVRVWLPARFARRRSNEKLLGEVARLGDRLVWSPTHAKILLISGPEGAYLATGCANLGRLTALDLINLRYGGADLAAHGAAMLEGLPVEAAPSLPEPNAAVADVLPFAREGRMPKFIQPDQLEEARERIAAGEKLAVVALATGISERQLRNRLGPVSALRGEHAPSQRDRSAARNSSLDAAREAVEGLVPDQERFEGVVGSTIGYVTRDELHTILAWLYQGLDLNAACALARVNWNLVTNIFQRGGRALAASAPLDELGRVAIALVGAQGLAQADAMVYVAEMGQRDQRALKMGLDMLDAARLVVDASGPSPGAQAAKDMAAQLDEEVGA